MQKKAYFLLTLLAILAISTFAQAAGSSTNDDSQMQIRPCADRETIKERIQCRLENRATTEAKEPNWASEESCKNLADTMNAQKTRLTKGLCRALYATAKQCYTMQDNGASKDETERCFQRVSGLRNTVSQDFENKQGVRKYLVLRLYNLQEKIEKAQENGRVSSDKAAEAIDLIVQIKEKIMNGENKDTIAPMIEELKSKIKEMKNE